MIRTQSSMGLIAKDVMDLLGNMYNSIKKIPLLSRQNISLRSTLLTGNNNWICAAPAMEVILLRSSLYFLLNLATAYQAIIYSITATSVNLMCMACNYSCLHKASVFRKVQ